ncbi:sulfite exporter TauE/SafE family protein [Microbulbifer rhizosphaerae]|uniref:Probable membrane transporter protein n=1 Tax=Microbulbifer rhizosphaerae TaxID=1562603 RepID=A0A7W4W7Z5_9GAMM|nr:sulfite exporter TauE/SafE family protein [Microbulbifer rhizosphaerae]MBB3059326.1 putative membrane protein YfcA [Microbulbifer rhizosphaerae]
MRHHASTGRSRLWLWGLWLAVFYGGWLILVAVFGHWQTAEDHWPMALAMALGSYAAGSTPMGGGTVGFPVLVLLFDMPASLGRDFSFAVQSIGMVSASIFILCRRQPLAWSMLRGAMLGSLVGTSLGIFLIAPFVADLWIKLTFAVLWGSFGVLHLYRLGEITSFTGDARGRERQDFSLGLVLGLLAGGFAAAVTGVGIDMVIYAALVVLCRVDLKIAIPTSVVIMAFTSVVGVVGKSLSGDWQPGVFGNWLAAAPVVALGAPLGVFVVSRIGRRPTLLVVAMLCVGQFVWTCFEESAVLGPRGLALAAMSLGVCILGFEWVRRIGMRLAGVDAGRTIHPGSQVPVSTGL